MDPDYFEAFYLTSLKHNNDTHVYVRCEDEAMARRMCAALLHGDADIVVRLSPQDPAAQYMQCHRYRGYMDPPSFAKLHHHKQGMCQFHQFVTREEKIDKLM